MFEFCDESGQTKIHIVGRLPCCFSTVDEHQLLVVSIKTKVAQILLEYSYR